MKKLFKYASLSAIAFFGAVSFSACSSSDDVVENNPKTNPDNTTVKTAITMNISRGGQTTRMASAVTQTNDQAFRGMYQIQIYPANILDNTSWGPIISGSDISAPVVSNEILAASTITSSASNKTYSGVQVSIGTNNFLFYGRAGLAAPTTPETKSSNGFTVPTFPTSSGTTAGITFTAQQIADPTAAGWTTPADVLVSYLNSIKNAFGSTAISSAALESIRLDFMKPNVARAGSADAVLATVNHMYTALDALTSLNEADAAIKTAVMNAIKANPASLSGSNIIWATGEVSPKLTETTFPANIGLPLGAAQYKYDSGTNAFVYITDAHSVAQTPLADYVYPSEIFYFTNTSLRETANNVTWPTTTAAWASENYSSGWTDAVQASSKNIALVNNVQYGTALLATKVKCTPSAGKLYDNSAELDPAATENKAITYAANMFPLTGVLIGAQPAAMGWNFLPTGSFTKCVYDKNVSWYDVNEASENREKTIYANSEDYSQPNYTLVYDNNGYDNDDDASTPAFVNICLEFTNSSGADFYGKDGLIKNGQKFYLVGKLDLTGKTKPTEFPAAVGNRNAIYYPSVDLRVFIQDYTTTAQCNITAGSTSTKGSLANALSCIPDMKAVTQEIGLSIDLGWTAGLSFDVSLGQ